MTSAEFARKYNLLKGVSERGARTYLAEQRGLTRGRIVMVHYLDVGSAEEGKGLLQRLGSISHDAMDKVVETAEVDGVTVVVTLFLPQFESLPAWLDASTPADAVRHSEHFDAAGAPTMIIGATPPKVTQPPPAPPHMPSPSQPQPASKKDEVGEFTRVFGGVKAAGPSPAEPRRAVPPPPPSLMTPPPPPSPPSPRVADARPAEPRRAGPGEFTRIFGKVDTAPQLDAPREPMLAPVEPLAPAPEAAAPSPPAAKSEGFTQLFERLAGTPASSPIVKPTPMPGAPPTMPPVAPSMIPSAITPPSPPAPTSRSAPSEFTRMLGRVSPPESSGGEAAAPPAPVLGGGALGGQAPPPMMLSGAIPRPPGLSKPPVAAKVKEGAAASAGDSTKRPIVLLVALVAVFLGALGLVLYFVLGS